MKKKILNVLIVAMLFMCLFCLTGCAKNNIEITIPSDFVEEATQEELTAAAQEKGYKSITLNEDGSATYVMTKSQHKELLSEMKKSFDESLEGMVNSEEYPNFKKIEANDNYTDFTITTTSTELDLNESLSVMVFYMCGGMYNVFSGEEVDNVHIKFVNETTGEVISETNSSEMGEEQL